MLRWLCGLCVCGCVDVCCGVDVDVWMDADDEVVCAHVLACPLSCALRRNCCSRFLVVICCPTPHPSPPPLLCLDPPVTATPVPHTAWAVRSGGLGEEKVSEKAYLPHYVSCHTQGLMVCLQPTQFA